MIVVVRCCCRSLCCDLSLWGLYKSNSLPERNIALSFWLRKNVGRHCEPFMMVDLSPVVVIDHTIFLIRSFFILVYCDWSQILMILYGLQSSLLFIYEDVYWEFCWNFSQDSASGCLYKLHQFPLVFNTKLIYSLNMSFAHHIFVVSLFVIILIASLTITHNWICYLRDIFWLLIIVWNNRWGSDCV